MNFPHKFLSFLQLVGLMIAGSALPIGIMEHNPTTELTVMFSGMTVFWIAWSLKAKFVEK